jgi:hypothetical protein
MDQSTNPYAPPKHDDVESAARPTGEVAARMEVIRREHLNAETNVKGLGFLLYLGAAGLIIGGLATVAGDALTGSLSFVVGAALILSGYWLRRLDRRGRLVYSIIATLGVVSMLLAGAGSEALSYQLGRMFWPLLFLAVIWSAKASTVMTPHYRDVVIPATPHIKYKVSPVLLVLLVLLIAVVIMVLAMG